MNRGHTLTTLWKVAGHRQDFFFLYRKFYRNLVSKVSTNEPWSYLWGTLGQWDILSCFSIWPRLISQFFFLMSHLWPFLFTNADVVTIKDRHLKKKTCETDARPIDIQWFHEFFRCLIFEFFFTNADVVKIKDETCKQNSWSQWR